jgi:hypothetical protein
MDCLAASSNVRRTYRRPAQLSLLCGLMLLASAVAARAQTVTAAQAREINNDVANNAVAAIEIFSAGKMVATGQFEYESPDRPDLEFSTFKLPGSLMFGSPSNSVRPFLEGYLGYFDLSEQVNEQNVGWGVLEVQSGTVTFGGGVELDLTDWLMLVPRLQFAYSHVEMQHKGTPPPPFDTILMSWRADALTTLPSLELRAHQRWGRWGVLASSHYSYLRVVGIDDTSEFIKLDSETHVWRNEISTRYHSPWRTLGMPLDFGALFARHDIAGQLRQSKVITHFYEVRGTVFAPLVKRVGPVSEVSFSGAYYFNEPFSGYSLGLSLAF